MMLLLLDSAVRSLLFGLLTWVLLKLLRMRDPGTETVIWTAVLVVALSMPLLRHYLPQLAVTIPHISSLPHHSMVARRLIDADDPSPRLFWFVRHARGCLLGAYALGLIVCSMRLGIGLLQTLRLYLRSVPVEADWAEGHHIRVSLTLKSPASLARVILVPADYFEWSAAKREAVLAHEGAHIARGDFFVQLAASVHCVVFWFSPFAWWLQSKLAEIAETASDETAIQRLNDRVTYAQILLEVACRAQPSASIVAMAKGPFIQQRVERILSEVPGRSPSAPLRALIIGSLPLVALPLATAKATIAPIPSMIPSIALSEKAAPAKAEVTASLSSRSPAGIPGARSAARTRRRVNPQVPGVPKTSAIVQDKDSRISYNPRALLDPVYTPARSYVPASTIVHDGKTFYILSGESPVADVAAANGTYPQDN